MRTPRRSIALAVALSTACGGVVAARSAEAATTAPKAVSVTKTYVLPSTDLPNALRGQYKWMGYDSQPTSYPSRDVYYRDQVYWGRIEPARGQYDFRWLEDGLKKAGASRSKFGFRVMAYCPGCWMDQRNTADWPRVTPSFVPRQPGTDIPDWNSEQFLSSWEALMAELGRRYGKDPRLGYVDVGGYGKYGEWWVDKGQTRITDANGLRLIAAVNKAFPTKHVLINTMTSVDFTLKALATNPRMGLRTDSLGAPNMHSMAAVDTRLQSVWKTRPFFTEWATTGDPVAGRDQVKKFHLSTTSSANMRLTYENMTSTQRSAYVDAVRSSGYRYHVSAVSIGALKRGTKIPVKVTIKNTGVAPTYDSWKVQLRLTDSTGQRAWTKSLGIRLSDHLPGTTKTYTRYVVVPTTLRRGSYAATLGVEDSAGYLRDMYLANGGRRSDGGYPITTVGVG